MNNSGEMDKKETPSSNESLCIEFTYWKKMLVKESVMISNYDPSMTAQDIVDKIREGEVSRDNMDIESGLEYVYDKGDVLGDVRIYELESEIDWESLEILGQFVV